MDQKLLNHVAELLVEYGVEDEEQVKSFIKDLETKFGAGDNDETKQEEVVSEEETNTELQDANGEDVVEEESKDVVEEQAPENAEEQPQEQPLETQPETDEKPLPKEETQTDLTQVYDSKINELNDTISTLAGRVETLEDVLAKLGHLKGDTTKAGLDDVEKKQEVSQELPMDEKELKYRRALGM